MREFKPGIYRHFKYIEYDALFVAKDSERREDVVVYKALCDEGLFWVRPLGMFLSEVDHEKYPDVDQKYRFEFIKAK